MAGKVIGNLFFTIEANVTKFYEGIRKITKQTEQFDKGYMAAVRKEIDANGRMMKSLVIRKDLTGKTTQYEIDQTGKVVKQVELYEETQKDAATSVQKGNKATSLSFAAAAGAAAAFAFELLKSSALAQFAMGLLSDVAEVAFIGIIHGLLGVTDWLAGTFVKAFEGVTAPLGHQGQMWSKALVSGMVVGIMTGNWNLLRNLITFGWKQATNRMAEVGRELAVALTGGMVAGLMRLYDLLIPTLVRAVTWHSPPIDQWEAAGRGLATSLIQGLWGGLADLATGLTTRLEGAFTWVLDGVTWAQEHILIPITTGLTALPGQIMGAITAGFTWTLDGVTWAKTHIIDPIINGITGLAAQIAAKLGEEVAEVGGAVSGAAKGLWDSLPKFQEGGYVSSTGPAFLHAGEYVLPPGVVNNINRGGNSAAITINISAPGGLTAGAGVALGSDLRSHLTDYLRGVVGA